MADYKDIAGRIRTTNADGVVVEAQEVRDLLLDKTQQAINADVQSGLANRYTKDETSGKTEISTALAKYADSVKYDSTTNYMEFYNGGTGGTKVFDLDATPFIVDGMVENVEIKSVASGSSEVTCLVISFNTDSGKQDINIPLTEIFDPSNYYTNAQTDEKIAEATSGKVDNSTYEAYTGATVTEIGSKLSKSDFNTYSGAVDTVINSKAAQSDLSTLSDTVTTHTANTDVHVTMSDKAKWNTVDNKQDISGMTAYATTATTEELDSRVDALESAVGSGGSIDSRIAAAKNEIIGDAASDYNTLGKLEDKIQAETSARTASESDLDSRVDDLESAIGSGGSIDSRIAVETNRAQGVESRLQDQINEIISKDATVSIVTRNTVGTTISAIFVGETTQVTLAASCNPASASKDGVPGIRIFREDIAVDGGTKDSGTSHSATVSETPSAASTIHYSAKFFISGLERTATRNLSAVDKIYYGDGVETISDYAAFAASISHKNPQVNTVGEYPFTTTEAHRYIYILVPTTMPAIVLSNVYLGKNPFNLLLLTSEAQIGGINYRVYRCVNAQQATSYTISIVS